MQSRTMILVSLLLPALALAQALPTEEFFHSGAQWYLSNKLAEARSQVDAGLKLYPDDLKLKKLDELLKQQQQQQQDQKDEQQDKQEQKQQDQKQDQQKDQQKQDQQKQDQKDQDQQKQQSSQDQKDKEKAQREQQQKEKERQEKQQQEQERQKAEQQKKQQQGGQGNQGSDPPEGEEAGQVQGMLTPQQARQILDAQKTDEKLLPVDIQKQQPKNATQRRFKDW